MVNDQMTTSKRGLFVSIVSDIAIKRMLNSNQKWKYVLLQEADLIQNIVHCCYTDAEEEERKVEWAEAAKKELDDWYKHHTEQLEKTKDNNR